MSVLEAVLIGLMTGCVFGFALKKSRVFEPGIIVGQMQLRNFVMLKVFLAAVITGLLVLAVMNGVFGVKLAVKPLLWRADLLGGLILGMGITLAGACPGTALAQLGAGYRDAWFIVLGGLAGALTYGYFDSAITGLFAETGEKLTFSFLLGMPFWALALVVAAALVGVLAWLETKTPWTEEVGQDHDGCLPSTPRRIAPVPGRARKA